MPLSTKHKTRFRQPLVYFGILAATLFLLWYFIEGFNLTSKGQPLPVELSRETFTVLRFRAHESPPKAVILFASGDGGWNNLEEDIARALQKHGYEVVGIDSPTYAQTDYNLAVLQSDFDTISQTVLAAYQPHPPPLIIGGYSMGAAQAIAAAGGPHPPQGMVGLLLVDPRSRGRYGLRSADKLDVMPTGPGTFGMDEFAPAMTNVRIVQWHAGEDSIDSLAWLEGVMAPHQALIFPGAKHDYSLNRAEFLRQLSQSVGWILKASPSAQGQSAAINSGATP